MSFKYEIADYTLELGLCDTVYVTLDKSTTSQMFKDKKSAPRKNDKPNKEYVEGELQYNIAKDSDDIFEILLFPVYKKGTGEYENGDFIIPPDYVLNNKDVKKDVISYLHQIRTSSTHNS
jgi:hypothetical protein